jgi:transposase
MTGGEGTRALRIEGQVRCLHEFWHRTASFAALCGASPIEASSGKTQRHRLNRGGDRRANSALYTIVIARLRWNTRTRDYIARRQTEGKTRREAIRCLKRYVAREIYQIITTPNSEAITPFAA